MKLVKDVKLCDFDKMEDGSHLIPIRCNITKKDQHENKPKIENFNRPRIKFTDLDSFLGSRLENIKYSWSRIHDGKILCSRDTNNSPIDPFIYNILNECADINRITKRIKELIGDQGKITLKIDFYDQTKVSSEINVSMHLETPLAKKTKSRENKSTTSKASSCEGEISKTTKKNKGEKIEKETSSPGKRKNRVLDDLEDLETEAIDIKTSKKRSDKHLNEVNKETKQSKMGKIDEVFKPAKRKSRVIDDSKDLETEVKTSKKHSDKNVKEVKKAIEQPKEKKSTKTKEAPIVDSAIDKNLQAAANTDNSVCQICQRKFTSERGKNQHIRMTHKQA
jgi:hypothetical protein